MGNNAGVVVGYGVIFPDGFNEDEIEYELPEGLEFERGGFEYETVFLVVKNTCTSDSDYGYVTIKVNDNMYNANTLLATAVAKCIELAPESFEDEQPTAPGWYALSSYG